MLSVRLVSCDALRHIVLDVAVKICIVFTLTADGSEECGSVLGGIL